MIEGQSNAGRWQLPTLIHRDGELTERLRRQKSELGLGSLPAKEMPDAVARSVCGFCSTGCGLAIHLRDGEAINVTPDQAYPVNNGMACPKGWESLRVLNAADRATTPLIRSGGADARPASWQQAVALFCERFKSIQAQHGPDSVAFISTGQIPTEEMVFLGCLAKFGMGIVHGDGNTVNVWRLRQWPISNPLVLMRHRSPMPISNFRTFWCS